MLLDDIINEMQQISKLMVILNLPVGSTQKRAAANSNSCGCSVYVFCVSTFIYLIRYLLPWNNHEPRTKVRKYINL